MFHEDVKLRGLLITNVHTVDGKKGDLGLRDLLLTDGIIAQIAPAGKLALHVTSTDTVHPAEQVSDSHENLLVIDGTALTAFPGLIDPHVHFRDPGQAEKEDITTGARAAARGGFTSVIMMGNTVPRIDTPDIIRDVINRGKNTGINVYTCANVTKGMEGKELVDMDACIEAGAVLFTDDGLPVHDEAVMRLACEEAAKRGKVISLHEEDPAFVTEAGINAGALAKEMGLTGASREAEIRMVERDIIIAEETGCAITVQHISAAESVELIRQAVQKAEAAGTKRLIHAEATPHHFSLTEDAVRIHGTCAKMNPPLREERDRLAIIEGLRDNTIDMIATDHAPHTPEEKAREFTKAPSGITGLETSLAYAVKELVQPNILTLPELACKMSYNAALLYGLDAGTIEVGAPADVTLFDMNGTWTYDETVSKSSNTPFLHETLPAPVRYTICGGRVVYRDT